MNRIITLILPPIPFDLFDAERAIRPAEQKAGGNYRAGVLFGQLVPIELGKGHGTTVVAKGSGNFRQGTGSHPDHFRGETVILHFQGDRNLVSHHQQIDIVWSLDRIQACHHAGHRPEKKDHLGMMTFEIADDIVQNFLLLVELSFHQPIDQGHGMQIGKTVNEAPMSPLIVIICAHFRRSIPSTRSQSFPTLV
jgi:hypothetical protein